MTITALEAERERLINVAQRDEAAIDVVDTRLRNAREDTVNVSLR